MLHFFDIGTHRKLDDYPLGPGLPTRPDKPGNPSVPLQPSTPGIPGTPEGPTWPGIPMKSKVLKKSNTDICHQ